MRDDDAELVLVEWFDPFIPPNRHVIVVSKALARRWWTQGMKIHVRIIDPELFNECAPPQRTGR